MTLPASFLKAGLVTPDQARFGGRKYRRLMLATEGSSDTGKTEFLFTCPGPGAIVCVDRGFDATMDNPKPPPTRRGDFGVFVMSFSSPTQEQQAVYQEQWKEFRKKTYEFKDIPEVRTLAIDGDSDTWEIQRLSDHGKLHGVYPQTRYTDTYAARRGFYSRLWDSGKIIVTTNKLKDEYEDVIGPDGLPMKDGQGEVMRRKTGERVAQGFPDQEYLWQIRIRHLYDETRKRWGLRILKCKADKDVQGLELWGADCTFTGLVSAVYPHIPLSDWGL